MASSAREAQLVYGPQDGAMVRSAISDLPPTIYLGRKWAGDEYSPWCRDRSDRFPEVYHRHGQKSDVYVHLVTYSNFGYKKK